MALDLTGVSLPFTVTDLVSAAMSLLTIVGPFVLLAIAFMVAPKFWNMVKSAIGNRGRQA